VWEVGGLESPGEDLDCVVLGGYFVEVAGAAGGGDYQSNSIRCIDMRWGEKALGRY
jgi:hypothetical protein